MPTSYDMIEMLRRHYIAENKPPAGVFAPEIQAPGSSGRRADLIWQGVTSAAGWELIGHEVKVTRADILNELSDLTKSDPWQRYCDRWWLVVPDLKLVDGLELPPAWGVLTPPSGRRTRSMTVAAPAPKLTPDDKTPALRTLTAWLHWKRHDAQTRQAEAERSLKATTEERDRLRRAAPAPLGSALSRERQLVADIVEALGGAGYDRIGTWGAPVKKADVIAALKDLGSVRGLVAQAEDTLERVRGQLKYVEESVKRTLKEAS